MNFVTVVTAIFMVLVQFQWAVAVNHTTSLQQDCSQLYPYIAIGDSYAAGIQAKHNGRLPECPQEPYCTTETCARNENAYSWQFATKYNLLDPTKYTFVACSGDDTSQCKATQVDKISQDTKLVTINIGGNNHRAFAKVIASCIYGHVVPHVCNHYLKSAKKTIDGIKPALVDLFQSIRGRANPDTIIQVFGYVWFWPDTNNPEQCQSFWLKNPNTEQKQTMNTLVTAMNDQLSQAAAETGVSFVDVNQAFNNHRLCDVNETWIQWDITALPGIGDDWDGEADPDIEWFNRGIFHPFPDGQTQYLNGLTDQLGCTNLITATNTQSEIVLV